MKIINSIGLAMMLIGFLIAYHSITTYHVIYEADIISNRIFISMMLGLFGLFFAVQEKHSIRSVQYD